MFKKILLVYILLCLLFPFILPAQEALKSVEEEYYDFLALQGLTQRPTLNYRTFSDSVWAVDTSADADTDASHPWQGQNLGTWHSLFADFRLRAYGPELFMSGNTAAPYGQNDGVLWQGRGFNTLLKGGVRFEGYGVELTLLPHFAFSQNAEFEIMPSAYGSEYGYFWGYAYNVGVDAPQRFGNKPFFDWDFGDSEIRYTWRTLTVGFGTQAIWLGPSQINSIIHSNNAPAYPKIDMGLRKQQVILPWINWYLGDIEFRLWAGRLQTSDYFNVPKSEHNTSQFNLLSGLSFAFAPSFLPGLTVFVNRTYIADWISESALSLLHLMNPFMLKVGGADVWDQRFSAGFDYLFPQVSLDLYAEIAYNDTPNTSMKKLISNFSHTLAFTAGIKKGITISKNRNIHSELMFEYTHLEMSPFYSQFYSTNSFYMHHEIVQGYTNKGQWLGAGIGTGGNSQYLGFKVYYTKGFFNLFLYRFNYDNDFLIRETTPSQGYPSEKLSSKLHIEKTAFTIGLEKCYFLTKYMSIIGELSFNEIFNNLYNDSNLHNFHFVLSIGMHF